MSLNVVLWFFRIAVFVVPIIVYAFTWRICREMQGVSGIGKRKRAVIISRSATGEYTAVPSPARPGDEHHEPEAEPVPGEIVLEPGPVHVGTVAVAVEGGDGDGVTAGVRRVIR